MVEFLAMGGYAKFVWGSFGLTAALLIWNVWVVRSRRASILERLRHPEDLEDEKQ